MGVAEETGSEVVFTISVYAPEPVGIDMSEASRNFYALATDRAGG
ncbi:unnamed protein product [marine sediment metagenome]|uniref:Uncharacterized protein n=1 Tax=marine sediment metagenome TaxID=412755 RepID=X1T3B7_9ZZZZ